MSIIEREKETYQDMWAVGSYADHSPGEMYLPVFLDMIHYQRSESSVLDAGCGSGKGMIALEKAGFEYIVGYDLTRDGLIPEAQRFDVIEGCLWEDLPIGHFDYIFCCDVLEHIPTQYTMLVIAQLLKHVRQSAFFSISFQPDVMGAWVGKTLHQTVQPFIWWRDSLAAVGNLIESRDMLHSGCFLVRPR